MSLPAGRTVRMATAVLGVAGGLTFTGATLGAVTAHAGINDCLRGYVCVYSQGSLVQTRLVPGETYNISGSRIDRIRNRGRYKVCVYRRPNQFLTLVRPGRTVVPPRNVRLRALRAVPESYRCPARVH